MKAEEILDRFLSVASWVDRASTVDKIIMGDPQKNIRKILVSLYPDLRAVKYAIDNSFDMLITHEPTFWNHSAELENLDKMEDNSPKKRAGLMKKKLIDDSGLVILRNHDVWDRMPGIGIPWAWAEFLGFEGEPAVIGAAGYQHRYDIRPTTLDDLAANIAKKTALIGEPGVQVIGDGGRKVSSIGIGTGCCCILESFVDMGCDAAIVSDDGCIYWKDIKWAMDIDFPIIRVNHATSEEPGMITLTEYINKNFDGVEAVHLPHRSSIRIISYS